MEQLSTGTLAKIMSGVNVPDPILQIIRSKQITAAPGKERYRLLLSDGKYQSSFVMTAGITPIEDLTIIKLTNYCLMDLNYTNICEILLITELEVFTAGAMVGELIGNPEPLTDEILARSVTTTLSPQWICLKEIVNKCLASAERVNYFQTVAMILFVRSENALYKACPSKKCNNKVVDLENRMYRCRRCNRDYTKFKYQLFVSINIADFSGDLWVSVFSSDAERILGKTAQEVAFAMETSTETYTALFQEANFKQFIFKYQARLRDCVEKRLKIMVANVQPLEYFTNNEVLFKSISQITEILLKQGTSNLSSRRIWLEEIVEGLDERGDYLKFYATILLVRPENALYKACLNEQCKKKVINLKSGMYRCEKCNREYPNFKYQLLVSMKVADFHGHKWVSVVSSEAEKILGKTAQEVGLAMETSNESYTALFQQANFKQFMFNCRWKIETCNDEAHIRMLVVNVGPLDYVIHNAHLCKSISQITEILLKQDTSNLSSQRIWLEEIVEGLDERGDYLKFYATILLVRPENALYKACLNEQCKKKVINLKSGMYRCEKCNREYPNFKYQLLVSMKVADFHGHKWVSVVSSEAEKILGKTAQEVGLAMETSNESYTALFQQANFKQFMFNCRWKIETCNDEAHIRMLVVNVGPLDYVIHNAHLCKSISQITEILLKQDTSNLSSQRIWLEEVVDGLGEGAAYLQFYATVLLVRSENALYKACLNEQCKKKVIDLKNGMYRCEKCHREYPNFKYQLLVYMKVADFHGHKWVSVVSSEAEKILGKTAQEVGLAMETSNESYTALFQQANFKQFMFNCRWKIETCNDEAHIRMLVVNVGPLDYVIHNAHLCKSISQITEILLKQDTSNLSSQRIWLEEVVDGLGEGAAYLQFYATVLLVRSENALYKACLNEQCKKKVIDLKNGMYRCEKCHREYPNFKYQLLVYMKVADFHGHKWVSVVSSEAEKILGKTAQEVGLAMETSNETYIALFQEANFKQFIFKSRWKIETCNGEAHVKILVVKVDPLDYVTHNARLCNSISHFTGIPLSL